MEKFLYNKNDNYWLIIIFVSLLCFGFYLTNDSLGIDDEYMEFYNNIYFYLSINRLAKYVVGNITNTFEYVPYFREFIGISLYIIGITMHSKLLMNYLNYNQFCFNKVAATIFSCVALSFPFIAFHQIFLVTCMEYGIFLILTAFAIVYTYKYFSDLKNIKYLGIIIFCLAFSFSLYEISLFYFMIPIFFIELMKFIYLENSTKKELYKGYILPISFSIVSAILSNIINLILKNYFLVGYNQFENVFKYDFSSIKSFFISFVTIQKEFIEKLINVSSYDFGATMIIICAILFFLYIFNHFIKNKKIEIIFAGVVIFLTSFSVFIILGNVDLPYRVYASIGFFNALVIALYYMLAVKHNKFIKLALVFVGVIIFFQAQELNQYFYIEHLKCNEDKEFAYNVVYDLKQRNLYEKPIIFIGVRETLKYNYFYNEAQEANVSIFNWDRYDKFIIEVLKSRIYYFFKELGFEIKSFADINNITSENIHEYIDEMKKQAKSMDIYPKDGSIKDFGEYVIVKIGKSKADVEE